MYGVILIRAIPHFGMFSHVILVCVSSVFYF